MNIEDLKQGQLLHYRAALSIPCEPTLAYFVAESGNYPDRAVIDLGATGYAPPYDRDRRIVWMANLTDPARP